MTPSGPCHRVDLADGLDTRSTAELHDLYACVNGTGALEAFAPVDVAMDAETREGAAGTVLAAWLADVPDHVDGVSARGALDTVRSVLDDPSTLETTSHAALELIYGVPWPDLAAGAPLNSASALGAGVLVPLLPTVGSVATVLLDDDLAALDIVADGLRSPMLPRAAWTLASARGSSDAALAPLGNNLAPDVADALERTRSRSNDRWSGASGDSLRDLLEALLVDTDTRGRPVIVGVSAPMLALLQDPSVQRGAVDAVRVEARAGRLRQLPDGLLHLASVDTDGGTLSAGEDSALVALLRLLHEGNTSFDCTVDLGFFDVDFSLGNLSVSLLETLADLDPSTVEGGVSLLGDALGFTLTDSILNGVADTGVCPVLDRQMVRDLHALDRLTDPQAGALLRTLLGLLDAARPRMDALVDTASALHTARLVPPLEEALRDLAGSPLVDDVVALVPALVDPWEHHDNGAFPADIDPLDLDAVWTIARDVLTPDTTGRSPLDHLSGVLNAAFVQEGTWDALGAMGVVLGDPRSVTPTLLDELPTVLEADPNLDAAQDLADLIQDDAFVRPLLVLAENDALRDALATTELTRPGPIPFTAGLIVDGTFDTLLDTLDLLAMLIPETATDE